jgi:hypothetical protein
MVEEFRGYDRDAIANETEPKDYLIKKLGEVIAPKAVKLEFPNED